MQINVSTGIQEEEGKMKTSRSDCGEVEETGEAPKGVKTGFGWHRQTGQLRLTQKALNREKFQALF